MVDVDDKVVLSMTEEERKLYKRREQFKMLTDMQKKVLKRECPPMNDLTPSDLASIPSVREAKRMLIEEHNKVCCLLDLWFVGF